MQDEENDALTNQISEAICKCFPPDRRPKIRPGFHKFNGNITMRRILVDVPANAMYDKKNLLELIPWEEDNQDSEKPVITGKGFEIHFLFDA